MPAGVSRRARHSKNRHRPMPNIPKSRVKIEIDMLSRIQVERLFQSLNQGLFKPAEKETGVDAPESVSAKTHSPLNSIA